MVGFALDGNSLILNHNSVFKMFLYLPLGPFSKSFVPPCIESVFQRNSFMGSVFITRQRCLRFSEILYAHRIYCDEVLINLIK